MKLLILNTTDPYYNLAVEEYLFSEGKDDYFMLWQNDRTVVIGKNQNAYAEISMDVLNEKGIRVARRITGGGAVYHDLGNLNYSFISSSNGNGIDFESFTRPMIEALSSLGVEATLSGRNDLVVGDKKISGNAQYSSKGRTLHHGTLLFDSDLSVLSSVLTVDEEKIKSKAIKSTRSRVTNIKTLLGVELDVSGFIAKIKDFVLEKYSAEVIEAPNSEKITYLAERNASDAWLFPEKGLAASYSILKKKRYPFGGVEVYLELSGDTVKDIKIRGDYFGIAPIEELEGLIINKKLSQIAELMTQMDIGDHIFGMSSEELVRLICE